MKSASLFLLAMLLCSAILAVTGRAEDGWSDAVNGLRARLVFGERHTQSGATISEVYLELHNVSDRGNLMEFDFSARKSVRYELQTADGKPASKFAALNGGNRCHDTLRIQLPMDGTLQFPVSCHSIATGPKSGRVIQLDPDDAIWEIPSTDASEYSLSGTLEIPKTPRDLNGHTWTWDGTIKIPAVKIADKR